MRYFGIITGISILAATLYSVNIAYSQSLSSPLQPPVIDIPPSQESLTEQVFSIALGETRAVIISAESVSFAKQMAAIYFDGRERKNWYHEVAQIHDPVRVSKLFYDAINIQLTAEVSDRSHFLSALQSVQTNAEPMLTKPELAARMALTLPDTMAAIDTQISANQTQETPLLAAIDEMIAAEDPVTPALAARMNRELAFAKGFIEAHGYDFPFTLDDTAADLTQQIPELRDKIAEKNRAVWYAALVPLRSEFSTSILITRKNDDVRKLLALIERAEQDVLDQLAIETGRAAAHRIKGTPL